MKIAGICLLAGILIEAGATLLPFLGDSHTAVHRISHSPGIAVSLWILGVPTGDSFPIVHLSITFVIQSLLFAIMTYLLFRMFKRIFLKEQKNEK